MCDAVTQSQPACCIGTLPCCVPCVQYKLREEVLVKVGGGFNGQTYLCGQGYYPNCCCFKPGQMGEKDNPELCLFCEACCCPGMAASASRFVVMDHYQLTPDPCDNKIIRFNNCLQMASCICYCAALFMPELRECAQILDLIADIVFYSTLGCMVGQVHHELAHRSQGASSPNPITKLGAPAAVELMER
jgi:hypothetical protein